MKIFLLTVTLGLLLGACSAKVSPSRDISNAKMALVQAETEEAGHYLPDEMVRVKVKYQNLQRLMQEERFDEAKLLAQEIQADARLLKKKSQRIRLMKELKKIESKIKE